MLRRLKSEVATELPPKTEQIIRVPLAPEQQTLYDEMRDLSRTRVMDTINQKGVGASTVTILDALLKLRQVACHPQLIKKIGGPSGALNRSTSACRLRVPPSR